MQLFKILDQRDNLAKARRKELEMFAETHNVTEIEEGMPAVLMRKILRQKGLVDINTPPRQLGAISQPTGLVEGGVAEVKSDAAEIDSETHLEAQWQAGRQIERPAKPVAEMTYWEMHAECKRRGIPVERGDKKHELEARLNGQDTAQLGQ